MYCLLFASCILLCLTLSSLTELCRVISGQNYRHQLELIFNVVGSPSDDYVNMTSDIIGDFLRSTTHSVYDWSPSLCVTVGCFTADEIDSVLVVSSRILLQFLRLRFLNR